MQCPPGTVGWAECGNAVAGGGAVWRSFGKAGLAVLLLGRGWKPVQLVGCVVVLPESLQRGLLVPAVICGGIEPHPVNWFLHGKLRGMHMTGQLQPIN